jgi:alpha-glucosidase/alpha-D-xyloside xylohydrolase
MLVAPVVEKGAVNRTLYLPKGSWIDYWTEESANGGREITRAVDMETTPLYVRAGAVIPHGPVKQYTGEAVTEPATLVIYPGATGSSTLYEDDGTSFDHRKGDYMKVAMNWADATRTLSLSLMPGSRMRPPSPRRFNVRIAGSKEIKTVTFTGAPVRVRM